jgi:hypothetical protein
VTITCGVDGAGAGAACGVVTIMRGGSDGGGATRGCACTWGIAGAAAPGAWRNAGAAR